MISRWLPSRAFFEGLKTICRGSRCGSVEPREERGDATGPLGVYLPPEQRIAQAESIVDFSARGHLPDGPAQNSRRGLVDRGGALGASREACRFHCSAAGQGKLFPPRSDLVGAISGKKATGCVYAVLSPEFSRTSAGLLASCPKFAARRRGGPASGGAERTRSVASR